MRRPELPDGRHPDGAHPDEVALSSLAVDGRPAAPADVVRHVEGCGSCRAEVAGLAEVLATARSVPPLDPAPQDPLGVPGPGAWSRVAADLDLADRRDPAGVGPPAHGRDAGDPGDALVPAPRATSSRVARRLLVGAGALGVLALAVGVGLAVAVDGTADDGTGGDRTAVALSPLGAAGEPGTVPADATAVVVDGEGPQEVVVRAAGLPALDDADYEVWLLDPAEGRLASLGVLDADGVARLAVPAGVEVADFPALDVSVEPRDGDPTHSGDSVLRGSV